MLMQLLTRRGFQVFLLLLLLIGAIYVQFDNPAPLRRLRAMTFDYYNKALPRKPGNDVVIIDIDEESLRRIGQWPWPRSVIGDIPVELAKLGVKSTTFDIVFAEPDRTSPSVIAKSLPQTPDFVPVIEKMNALPDNDSVFAQKISMAGNVVTGFVASGIEANGVPQLKASCLRKKREGTDGDPLKFMLGKRNYAVSLPALTMAAAGNGAFSAEPEEDGVIRAVPLMMKRVGDTDGLAYPTLSLEALRVGLQLPCYSIDSDRSGIWGVSIGDLYAPTDNYGRMYVYFAGHRKDLYIPAWKVLAHDVPKALVQGKFALLGTSAIGLLDLRSSPLNTVLPGVEVHAEMIEQILHHQFLARTPEIVQAEVVAMVLVSLGIIFLAPFISAGTLAFIAAVIIGGGVMGGFYLYDTRGTLVDPYYPALVILIIFVLSSILTNLRSDREKRMIRQAFSHYISPILMEELAGNPEKLKLGGEVRELSVMFTDIRNFTTISESMDPADLIKMMNDFLTPMTSAVLENRGTVDKYMGDAMMAFWNAPVEDIDHARNACKAALEMVRSLAPVNEKLKKQALDAGRVFHELKAGIGINSGRTSVGNMGSKQRFAYSALGDTVNLASRMEGQTKGYGVSVMISEETRRQAPEYGAIELDLLAVKGRAEPERVYALLASPEDAMKPEFKSFVEKHDAMLATYRARNWGEALLLGEECVKMMPQLAGLYRLYAQRIAVYKEKPPADDWQGLWVATEK